MPEIHEPAVVMAEIPKSVIATMAKIDLKSGRSQTAEIG